MFIDDIHSRSLKSFSDNSEKTRKPHIVYKIFDKHIITLDKEVDPQENERFVMERLPNRDVLLRNIEK